MSEQSADARTFSATRTSAAAALPRELAAPTVMVAAGIVAVLAIAVVNAALRGPWLDEFWTLELSDHRRGLWALVREGWLRDAHPPLFNAWATLLASLGLSSIPAGRLVSNLLAAGLMMLAALLLSRRERGLAGFNAVLLLLTFSLPQAVESFALYRSYFGQMTAMAILTMIARYVVSARADLDGRRDMALAAIAVMAITGSMAIHYVGGLFGGLLAAAIAVSALVRGLRRWAGLLLVSAALSSLFVVASVALQAGAWAAEFDHSWIDLPLLGALGVMASLVVAPLWLNAVPLIGLGLRRDGRDPGELRFVAMVGGVLVVGIAIVLAVHAVKPIVVDRYLFAIPVLVSAVMAVLAARLMHDRLLLGVLVLVAVMGAARPVVETGIKPLWRENARTIAAIVTGCPTTEVYAASGWTLGPAANTRAARREDPVFERAYRSLAERYGYAVRFIAINGSARATPGACPVLLWFEHTPNEAETDLPAAIECAGLTGLHHARLSVTRSATGFVIRADRPGP
jgi:MFS family permease